MDNSWYINVGGQSFGPYSQEHLRAMIARGEASADSLVFNQATGAWYPANHYPQLVQQAAVQQP